MLSKRLWVNIEKKGQVAQVSSCILLGLTPEQHSASDSSASDAGLITLFEGEWGRESVDLYPPFASFLLGIHSSLKI